MKRILMALVLVPSVGLAQSDGELRYTWIQLAHTMSVVEVPGDDLDLSGWDFDVSFAVRDVLHLFAEYETWELDDFDQVNGNEKTFGIGAHFTVAERFSLFGRVGYIDVTAEDGFDNFSDDGIRAIGGARIMPIPGVELRGGVDYVDLDLSGDDTATFAGAEIWLADGIALNADVELYEDGETYRVGGRIYFGD